MNLDHKTKKQLMEELCTLRQRVTALEACESDWEQSKRDAFQTNARLSAILKAFDGLIYVCSRDFRIEFMNDRLIERTGYNATGELCYKVLHGRDGVCPWCVNDRVFNGETVRWEIQSPKDDQWFYVVNTPLCNKDGTVSKQSMIIDITERKQAEEALLRDHADLEQVVADRTAELVAKNRQLTQAVQQHRRAEQALRQSEEKYRGLVDNIGIGISLISPGMEILTLNEQMKRWFPDIDLAQKPICYKVFNNPPRQSVCEYCPTYQTLQDGQVHQSVTETPDGDRIRHYKIISSPIKDSAGKVTAAIEMVEEITEQKKAQLALQSSEKQLRNFSRRLQGAQEEERKRISRDLHDSIGQSLMVIKLKVEKALKSLPAGDRNEKMIAEPLKSLLSLIQSCVEETRRICSGLRPHMLDDIGVIATIGWFCRSFHITFPSILIRRTIEVDEDQIPEPLKIVIFRILQEALNNATKYSRATLVNIGLVGKGGRLELSITDNGAGFELDAVLADNNFDRGLGLSGMRERAELSGGRFKMESIKGKGTSIFASWDCDPVK
jgi:PAS domain S-box-containing protein